MIQNFAIGLTGRPLDSVVSVISVVLVALVVTRIIVMQVAYVLEVVFVVGVLFVAAVVRQLHCNLSSACSICIAT